MDYGIKEGICVKKIKADTEITAVFMDQGVESDIEVTIRYAKGCNSDNLFTKAMDEYVYEDLGIDDGDDVEPRYFEEFKNIWDNVVAEIKTICLEYNIKSDIIED